MACGSCGRIGRCGGRMSEWAGPLTKPMPRRAVKSAARRTAKAHRRDVSIAVAARDGGQCRACRRWVDVTMRPVMNRAEQHHIQPRSLGGPDTTANLITLCLLCHSARHVSRALSMEGDADGVVTFTRGGHSWTG